MARSSIDRSPGSDKPRAQDRPSDVTLVMNPSAGAAGRLGGVSGRAAPVGETMSMLSSVADLAPEAEEPSIEEYMAALLARTNQFSASPTGTIPRPAKPTVEKVVPSSPSPPAASQPAVVPLSAVGPPAVPECRTAFSELRELANSSAQSTFNTHLAQRLVLEMHSKRFVAVVAMLASLALLSLASSAESYAYLGAVVAVITACVWSLQYLSLGRALSRVCAESRPTDARTTDRPD